MAGFDPFIAEWRSVAANPRYSLTERSLKMAQLLEYPDLDVSKYIAEIAQLRESFRLGLDSGLDEASKIKALGSYVFGRCGFSGNFEDHYDPRNNFLNDVIDRRSGIAITIAIVYAEIARGAGLAMNLVSFPGRVLARCGGEIIDPLTGGRILGRADLASLLKASGLHSSELAPEMLAVASAERLLVRMARNLKHSYMHSYAHEKALRCALIALTLARDSPEDVRDAGLLRARLQDRDGALEDLNRYLEINPNGDDVDHVIEIIRQIRSSRR